MVAASFLGWTLDAFDFFLMVFVLADIAREFKTDITKVTIAILLTLATRRFEHLLGEHVLGRHRRFLAGGMLAAQLHKAST